MKMHKSEQELRNDLDKATSQLSQSNLALARLSISESTGEVMVGYENGQGIPLVRRLSAIDDPSPLRESKESLISKLEGASEFIVTGGLYKHYKSSDMLYEVARLAIFEETGEVMVGYDAQYGEMLPFERVFSSFVDFVKTDKGLVERFSEV